MKSSVRVALCQSKSLVGDGRFDPRKGNLESALGKIEDASRQGADLVVFGEGYLTGYATGASLSRYAVSLDPPSWYITQLEDVARERGVHVIMGMTTRQRGGRYNSAVFVGPRGMIGSYNKTHLFVGPCMSMNMDERVWWRQGKEIPVFASQIGRVGIEVCYDISFPEVSRILAIKGADIIVNVAAEFEGYQSFWDTIPRARALENQTWHALCSVVGRQVKLAMFGGSRIVDPSGSEVARARDRREETLMFEVDYRIARRERKSLDLSANRRPRLYAPLTDGAR